jgi:hypothetical protein
VVRSSSGFEICSSGGRSEASKKDLYGSEINGEGKMNLEQWFKLKLKEFENDPEFLHIGIKYLEDENKILRKENRNLRLLIRKLKRERDQENENSLS